MAFIRPLRAWRYNPGLTRDIGKLISPPFDVVSEKQRQALYQLPYNSIHLSVPQGPQPALRAADTLKHWKKEGILQQESSPCIYTYYQHFQLPGSQRSYCRKGFICFIRASFWEDQQVLRHEDTMPASVSERTALLQATRLNASPTHGLYEDPAHQLEPYMDQSMENPLYEAEDYQGVRDVLGVIEDPHIIQLFVQAMHDKKIILADGHHRYESSLIYRRQRMEQEGQVSGREGYHYHLMYLTNTESDDLRILPTHRLLRQIPFQNTQEEILAKSSRYFHISAVDDACDLQDIIAGKPWTFGLLMKEQSYILRLKEEVFPEISWQVAEAVKRLDTIVLHYFFIEKVLGIRQEEQKHSPLLYYERNFAQCIYQVAMQEACMALIVNSVSVEQVKEICYSGQLMPQKSTYFYPKAICGFVFGSIQDDEI